MARVNLRDVVGTDREMLREWRNLPDVARYMYTDHEIGPDEHAVWFASAMRDPSRRYWIVQLDGEDVGLANVYAIDEVHSHAAWAFYLASPQVRGKGVGSYVEFHVLRHVFDVLQLHRLTCEVLAFNDSVMAMHEGFGFKREGVLREHIRKHDGFADIVVLGMLRREWEELRPTLRDRLVRRGLLEP